MEPSKPTIIAVCGKAGSGKDTVTKYMIELLEKEENQHLKYESFAHAEPFKRILIEHLYFTERQVYEHELKDIKNPIWNKSARESMILLGSQMFRNQYDEDTWAKVMREKIKRSEADFVFVTDLRFVNETKYLLEQGVKIIHVSRDKKYLTKRYNICRAIMSKMQWLYPILHRCGLLSFRWHLSELLNIPKYEHIRIDNYGTLKELKEKTNDLMTDLICTRNLKLKEEK